MSNPKLLLLVVDDSALILHKIKELLQGCEAIERIITTQNFDDAISILDEEKPDVALIDINLADKSGIEILRHIRQKKYNTQVIMFTNDVSDSNKDLCSKIGADHFIDKSKDFDKLLSIFSTVKISYLE